MAEGEGDGVPRQGGADLEQSRVGRGPSTAREEVGGQDPRERRRWYGESGGRIQRNTVRRLDKSKSPHFPRGCMMYSACYGGPGNTQVDQEDAKL